jgi:hypothetical protein
MVCKPPAAWVHKQSILRLFHTNQQIRSTIAPLDQSVEFYN